ncbi:type I restriction enzyme, R subunit [Pseudoalteromonas ulvae UL12]|nr:hypothetical protein [Pseudoalteromonas ulvae]MBE0364102.1 type I restriction enzyme, R subunit [Pseudoalteromonas ulvae UL12]
MDKRKLSETDIISKFILPAVKTAGWGDITQIRQEVKLRDGKVIGRGYLGDESIVTTMIKLNNGILNKMALLLSPVEEQHRIVTKVDELMSL